MIKKNNLFIEDHLFVYNKDKNIKIRKILEEGNLVFKKDIVHLQKNYCITFKKWT